jgi:hypothetical protein
MAVSQREFVRDMNNSKFEKIALIHANGKAMALLEWMKFVMKKNNALVVSIETMALIFNVDARSIKRYVKFLNDNKLIRIAKTGTSNIYFINSNVSRWDTTSAPVAFSFSAEIVISDAETLELSEYIRKTQKSLADDINPSLKPKKESVM